MTSAIAGPANSELGKDQFLKLFVTQAKNQNPLDPQDNSEFLAQLAQFSSLEQLSNLNTSFASLLQLEQFNAGRELIGKTVSFYSAQTALPASGVVSGVGTRDGSIGVTVGEEFVPLSNVIEINGKSDS